MLVFSAKADTFTRYVAILVVASVGFATEALAQEKILAWDGEAAAQFSSSVVQLRNGPNGEVVATISTETLRRLVEIKNRIAEAANQPAHLFILSGSEPNAMASKKDGSPQIAINVAMINLLGDDYDAYAAIIGHELAHLVRDHGATRESREGARSVISSILGTILGRYGIPLGGTIASIGTNAVSRTFSRDEEREADSLGLSYMQQAGYDPNGGVRAWERMGAVAKSRGFPFLSTHPAPEERLETMRAVARNYAQPSSVVASSPAPKEGNQESSSQSGHTSALTSDPKREVATLETRPKEDLVVTSTAITNELQQLTAGTVFRDCADCPEMVVIPPGNYMMGGSRAISIPRAYAVGKFEVTFAQWDACVAAGGCTHKPDDKGWGRGSRPVMNVSWDDAKQYTAWLTQKSRKSYRLLTDAEWEYAARAGTTTAYYWGDSDTDICQYASVAKGGNGCGADKTSPVGERRANAFGLHDMLGNVWEWTEDCWNTGIDGVPADSSARITGECGLRVVRGGSWDDNPGFARAAIRDGGSVGDRDVISGFRVARTN